MRKSLVALATAVALVTPGCSWFKTEAKVAKNAAIDCVKQDLGTTVTIGDVTVSVLLAVVSIVADGGTNWRADLDKLGAKYGPELVACAAKTAVAFFNGLDGAGSGALSTGMGIESPKSRASSYVAGYTFK